MADIIDFGFYRKFRIVVPVDMRMLGIKPSRPRGRPKGRSGNHMAHPPIES